MLTRISLGTGNIYSMKKLTSVSLSPLLRRLLSWGAALACVFVWHQLAQVVLGQVFEVKLSQAAYTRDLAAHLLIGAFLFGISRSLSSFMVATTALFTALTVGNALKLSVLGAPVMPDDFAAARNMFLLLDGWLLVGAVLLVATPVILLGWSIAWKRPRAWVGFAVLGLAVASVARFPEPILATLDKRLGNSVWNQPANYQTRGLPIHLLQESARNLSRRTAPPTAAEVSAALVVVEHARKGGFVKVAAAQAVRRNLHMIVLESFWDPMILSASELSADPMDPDFRALWAATDQSHLLSPVFGGYTANTEFEVLCGFPVNQNNVYFEFGLRREAPCLPRHLTDAGYHSITSHPNSASFWNRINAYRRIGFDTYLADKDFVLDDMNRSFLSDESMYRQVLQRLAPELRESKPVFNYMLTYFGHLPYPLNERRPAVITTAQGHDVVAAYANTIYYKSRELMALLRELRQTDPDALIVLFGDHLPALEPNFGGYTDSGVLAKRRGDFDAAMFRTLVETPLIVIDGQRGPVAVGDVPAYQLPALLLELLGDHRPSIMELTTQTPGEPRIRPLPGVHLVIGESVLEVCRDPDLDTPGCTDSGAWVKAVETLRTDLFSGKQHALRDLRLPDTDFREAAVSLTSHPSQGHF